EQVAHVVDSGERRARPLLAALGSWRLADDHYRALAHRRIHGSVVSAPLEDDGLPADVRQLLAVRDPGDRLRWLEGNTATLTADEAAAHLTHESMRVPLQEELLWKVIDDVDGLPQALLANLASVSDSALAVLATLDLSATELRLLSDEAFSR